MTSSALFYKVPPIAQRGLYFLGRFRRFILKVDCFPHPQADFYIVPLKMPPTDSFVAALKRRQVLSGTTGKQRFHIPDYLYLDSWPRGLVVLDVLFVGGRFQSQFVSEPISEFISAQTDLFGWWYQLACCLEYIVSLCLPKAKTRS